MKRRSRKLLEEILRDRRDEAAAEFAKTSAEAGRARLCFARADTELERFSLERVRSLRVQGKNSTAGGAWHGLDGVEARLGEGLRERAGSRHEAAGRLRRSNQRVHDSIKTLARAIALDKAISRKTEISRPRTHPQSE